MFITDFLKAAPPAAVKVPKDKVNKVFRRDRVRVFLMIFIGYMCYYLVRKNFVIASPYIMHDLHFSLEDVGYINTALAISYGVFKLFIGNVENKGNVKKFIGLGLLGSSIISILMGSIAGSVMSFIILMIVNGVFQSMGAPASTLVISKWFSKEERGITFAGWNTSCNLGGALIGPIGALCIMLFGVAHYQTIFHIPAIICIIVAFLVLIFGADSPSSKGLPTIEEYKKVEVKDKKQTVERSNLTAFQIFKYYIIGNKYVWLFALSNVFVYLLREGIENWIPIYLERVKHFNTDALGLGLFLFEITAIPITLLAGWMSDKYFKGRRAPLSILGLAVLIIGLIIYYKSTNETLVMIAIAIMGGAIYIPQLLVSTAMIDVVPKFAAAGSIGFAGICAYVIGETTADTGIGIIAQHFGWGAVFVVLIVGAIIGIILLCFCLKAKAKPVLEEHICTEDL
ncbi:MAG: MFS transporter [Clostridium sp.]|uniref:MFS transporter n=1 Tax=Clostridium sp. TaxID=1506 RepID=UPI003F416973